MVKKAMLLVGVGVGFVLGSRAGRGPYETLEGKVRQAAGRPEVQGTVEELKVVAVDKADQVISSVSDKLPGNVGESISQGAHEL